MNSRFSFTAIGAFLKSNLQWQPTLTAHDPKPPITIDSALSRLLKFTGNTYASQDMNLGRAAGFAAVFAAAAVSTAPPVRACASFQQTHAVHQAVNHDATATRSVWASQRAGARPSEFTYVVAAPERRDLGLPPQIWAAVRATIAASAPAKYVSALPQNDLTPPSVVWRSAPGRQGPTVYQFDAAPLQVNLTLPAQVWRSAPGQQGPTVRPFIAAPQPVDLTQPAVYSAPVIGRIPALAYTRAAPQYDLTPTTAEIFSPAVAPSGIITGPTVYQFENGPQQLDLTLQPQIWRSAPGYQGPSIEQFVAAPLPVDLTQQPLYIAPTIIRLPALPFAWASPQYDLTPPSIVWRSAPGYQGPSVEQFVAGPLQQDFTLQAWYSAPVSRQGPVPPLVYGTAQADPTQLPAQVWKSLATPPITTGILGRFLLTTEQPQDRPTVAVWVAQVRGQTPPVIPQLYAQPQLLDLTQQGSIWASAFTPPVLTSVPKLIYARHQVYDFTLQPWFVGPTIGRLPPHPFVTATPQALDLTQQGSVWAAAPAVRGSVPKLVYARHQVIDLTQQGSVWSPVKLPQGRPPPIILAAPQLWDATQQAYYSPPGYTTIIPVLQIGTGRTIIGQGEQTVLGQRSESVIYADLIGSVIGDDDGTVLGDDSPAVILGQS